MERVLAAVFDYYAGNTDGWEVRALVMRPTGLIGVVTERPSSPLGPDRCFQFAIANEAGVGSHTYDLTWPEAMAILHPWAETGVVP